MPSKRNRKPLRSPFVTTVAIASAALMTVAAGCTSTVAFTDDSCDFGDPGCTEACPSAKPSHGSACTQNGQSCADYGRCGDGFVTCSAGAWKQEPHRGDCPLPPPDPCPTALPTHGTPCQYDYLRPYTCDGYRDELCDLPVTALCALDGIWQTDQIDCNPPPPVLCNDIVDSDSCELSGCRWLVPGCGEPTTGFAACFASEECTDSSCDVGWACSTVVLDPCWNSTCDACYMETNVCLPKTG
jgi:hypothetical protein